MPFVLDENHPNAKFSTHVWRDDEDEDGIANPYTTETEARSAFDKLESGGRYKYGGLYRWVDGKRDWDCMDAWPEEFNGFDNVKD